MTPLPGDVYALADRRFYVLRRLKCGTLVIQIDSGSGFGSASTGAIPPMAQKISGARWTPTSRSDIHVDGISYVAVDGVVLARANTADMEVV